jgi:protein MpaA
MNTHLNDSSQARFESAAPSPISALRQVNQRVQKAFVFGHTPQGFPIMAYRFGEGQGPKVLILGGVHGDEYEGVVACLGLLSHFSQDYSLKLEVTLVPRLNEEGVLFQTRWNSNEVDLNRNLPTKDWTAEWTNPRYKPGREPGSEPENKAIMAFLESEKPCLIISMHSWEPMINTNGNCDPEAQVIAKMTGYKIEPYIGYPTPGSLGTYAGQERGIPTITYEIQRGSKPDEVLRIHVPALLAALKESQSRAMREATR